ncbi:MAG: MarR family transcriptional regulator [Brachybacterium sp.]|uniref:MarR family winged helix-turn-helix transcriptional regulator n=1 Tax=Brachybacterium sp. TaxID=1891286 RepID=UPI00264A360D|nr:MarR family transcriptional regulator [Brachybacterium sp.]MDN5685217.1 MarR family transcriptional regulator [Brachybacterium sp.]
MPVQRNVSALIPVVAREHRSLAGELLQPLGLYPGQELALMLLAESSPRSLAELAEILRVTAPTMTVMIQRMEKKGLVTKERSTENRRQVEVRLTVEGERTHDRVLALWDILDARTVSHLTAAEEVELQRLLRLALAGVREAAAD